MNARRKADLIYNPARSRNASSPRLLQPTTSQALSDSYCSIQRPRASKLASKHPFHFSAIMPHRLGRGTTGPSYLHTAPPCIPHQSTTSEVVGDRSDLMPQVYVGTYAHTAPDKSDQAKETCLPNYLLACESALSVCRRFRPSVSQHCVNKMHGAVLVPPRCFLLPFDLSRPRPPISKIGALCANTVSTFCAVWIRYNTESVGGCEHILHPELPVLALGILGLVSKVPDRECALRVHFFIYPFVNSIMIRPTYISYHLPNLHIPTKNIRLNAPNLVSCHAIREHGPECEESERRKDKTRRRKKKKEAETARRRRSSLT